MLAAGCTFFSVLLLLLLLLLPRPGAGPTTSFLFPALSWSYRTSLMRNGGDGGRKDVEDDCRKMLFFFCVEGDGGDGGHVAAGGWSWLLLLLLLELPQPVVSAPAKMFPTEILSTVSLSLPRPPRDDHDEIDDCEGTADEWSGDRDRPPATVCLRRRLIAAVDRRPFLPLVVDDPSPSFRRPIRLARAMVSSSTEDTEPDRDRRWPLPASSSGVPACRAELFFGETQLCGNIA